MTGVVTNPFEAHARLTKAIQLAQHLRGKGLWAGRCAEFSGARWSHEAAEAGVHPPSQQTVAKVLALLAAEEPPPAPEPTVSLDDLLDVDVLTKLVREVDALHAGRSTARVVASIAGQLVAGLRERPEAT